MAKVIGYVRVSTDGQVGEDKFGLDVQRRQIIEYCEANGYELLDIVADEGFSGAKIDRPGLTNILKESETGEFDFVVVAKYDRLSRELFIQLWIEKELEKSRIKVLSATEPYSGDDTMTKAFRQMIGVFAELERGRITERLESGRREKASKGGYAGGQPPLGYTAERGTGRLVIDEEKAPIVREVFEMKSAGLTLQKIADALNDKGFTTRQDKRFSAMQIKRILDNEAIYRGGYIYDKKGNKQVVDSASHEAIL